MNYSDFCEKVRSAVSEVYGDEAAICVTNVTKNNGLILKGLVIQRKESRISPTIYLEQFYAMYEDGMTFGEVINRIMACDRRYTGADINVEMFLDFDRMKERIIYKVVNRKMNSELLKSVPYIEWNDLAIVFCCLMESGYDGYATVLVRNEHIRSWDTDAGELYELASVNTPKLMADEIDDIESIISHMLGERSSGDAEDCDGMADGISSAMYVLTNERRIFGATCMLYSRYIRELAMTCDSDLYILPSSIHEVILLPFHGSCDEDYMRTMVREINETQVDVEDRLSDNIYYYDRGSDEIRVVAG